MKYVAGTFFCLVLSFYTNLDAQATDPHILKVQEFTKNFSRVQELINQKRGVIHAQEEGGFLSNPDVPVEVQQEAKDLAATAETWGCEMKLNELPEEEIVFGDQKITVHPFEIQYAGAGCPLDLVAKMVAKTSQTDLSVMEISVSIIMKVLDPNKTAYFGFSEAKVTQTASINANQSEEKMTMKVSINSDMSMKGTPYGDGSLKTGMAMDINFNFPLDLNMRSEANHTVTLLGVQTHLKSSETITGFTDSKAEYFVNDKPVSKDNFDSILQGMQIFGIAEEFSERVGTLSCTFSAAENPAQQINFCDKDQKMSLGATQINAQFLPNWMLVTLQAPNQKALEVFFLYDENSNFTRAYANQTYTLTCKAVKACGE